MTKETSAAELMLETFYKGTLICPVKGCYEKDPVRYLNRDVLAAHTRYDHVAYMDIKAAHPKRPPEGRTE